MDSTQKEQAEKERKERLGVLIGDIKATRKNLAIFALVGGAFLAITFGVIGLSPWIALVTVLIAAFFIFKLMKEFTDLQALGREIAEVERPTKAQGN